MEKLFERNRYMEIKTPQEIAKEHLLENRKKLIQNLAIFGVDNTSFKRKLADVDDKASTKKNAEGKEVLTKKGELETQLLNVQNKIEASVWILGIVDEMLVNEYSINSKKLKGTE